jgi:hypothetical protein
MALAKFQLRLDRKASSVTTSNRDAQGRKTEPLGRTSRPCSSAPACKNDSRRQTCRLGHTNQRPRLALH